MDDDRDTSAAAAAAARVISCCYYFTFYALCTDDEISLLRLATDNVQTQHETN